MKTKKFAKRNQDVDRSRPEPYLASPGVFVKAAEVEEVELVLPFGYLSKIREHLFSDTSREYLCHLLCGHTLVGNRLRFLACYFAHPESEDYVEQSMGSIRIDPEYDLRLRKECKRLNLSLVDIHSHPFSDHHVGFSGIDDHDEVEKYHYFERNLPESAFGSIVMGKSSLEGRIFLSAPNAQRPRVLPLKVLSRDIPLVGSIESFESSVEDQRFDRQIRAFGIEGQRNLASLKVGIVGLGGLGASLAIGLARLGVKEFVLIDPDKAEPNNLNRLAVMTAIDSRLGPDKVDLVSRRIAEIDLDTSIDASPADVFEPGAWQKLRDVDVLIATTDNHSTRMLLNAISHQYLLPFLSVGTQISTHERQFKNGFGELYCVLPGQSEPCLLCSQAIDKAEAYYELSSEEHRREAAERGYIGDFDAPAPAVYHLNGVMTNLALVEIHNMACDFMPRRVHLHYSMIERRVLTIEDELDHCGVCSPDGLNFARGDQIDPVAHLFNLTEIGKERELVAEDGESHDEFRSEGV